MFGQSFVNEARPSWTWAIVAMALGVLLAAWAMLRFAAQPEDPEGLSFAWALLLIGLLVVGMGFAGLYLLLRQMALQEQIDEPNG